MELPQVIRDRVSAEDIPQQAYAAVGAGIALRERAMAWADRAGAALTQAARRKDEAVTTLLQAGHEARGRAASLPSDAVSAARAAGGRLVDLPAQARGALEERVIDLRDASADQYAVFSAAGERAVAHWHAERVLNERAERLTKSVTPAAARATVSARDAVLRASASPTGQRVAQAGRRASGSARKAWTDYQTAVQESGSGSWGEAAGNGTAGRPAAPRAGRT